MSAEQYITSAKQGLTNARGYLGKSNWVDGLASVRACIGYVNTSQLMLNPNRLDERLWILAEVQRFAFNDADAGGVQDLVSWCELEYNRILASYPGHVPTLKALGKLWLAKSQVWLAKIHREEHGCADAGSESRRYTSNYVEARNTLIPAVDFLVRATDMASKQGCLTGDMLALRAEASMSLGNVSPAKDAQPRIKDALLCLKSAYQSPGYVLPDHLRRYLRDNEYLIRM